MTTAPGKAPKKQKAKGQTPEERLEAMRYNHTMYGPTAGEFRPIAKKIDFGAAYLKHPKFQGLMTAFKNGSNFQFTVTNKGKDHNISTDGVHIFFDGKVIYYSRALNKYEHNLLVDRTVMLQFKGNDAFVHLVFAVIRSLPELGAPPFSHKNNEFYFGTEKLEVGMLEQGPNLMIGAYKTTSGKAK